jgi:hypothetical protein
MNNRYIIPSISKAAGLGAVLGFTAALAYGALFCLYVAARVAVSILQAPANGTATTIFANTLSLIVAAAFFAIVCGVLAAPVEAAALGSTAALSRRWNHASSPWRGAWIGLGCAAFLLLVLYGLIAAAPPLLARLLWESGYLLWSGFPALIFLTLNLWLGKNIKFSPAG